MTHTLLLWIIQVLSPLIFLAVFLYPLLLARRNILFPSPSETGLPEPRTGCCSGTSGRRKANRAVCLAIWDRKGHQRSRELLAASSARDTNSHQQSWSEAPQSGEGGRSRGGGGCPSPERAPGPSSRPRADRSGRGASPPPGSARGPHGGGRRAGPCLSPGACLLHPGETGTGGPGGTGSRQGGFLTRGRSLEIGKKRRLKLSATSTA